MSEAIPTPAQTQTKQFSVDGNEPCTFKEFVEANYQDMGMDYLYEVLNLKVGASTFCGGICEVKRIS